ncbi:zinc finger protein ZAT1-like [Macadamia integrifolia]|uniref:zinc finger protein ZAT1-like n=1 Tax=Macadamia integrifolia TaxID=60698 RepID=UPI001C4FC8FB|nr:zinc finger protein ZAT1-like [Macadamia integrifolia]
MSQNEENGDVLPSWSITGKRGRKHTQGQGPMNTLSSSASNGGEPSKSITNVDIVSSSSSSPSSDKETAHSLLMLSSSSSSTIVSNGTTVEDDRRRLRRRREKKCDICGRIFSSFQALGGHRAGHMKRVWSSYGNGGGDYEETLPRQVKEYECTYCSAIYPSGAALGGHMKYCSKKNLL